MYRLIPMVMAISLLLLGLSYLFQTARWIRFMRTIMQAPETFFGGALIMVAAGVVVGYGYNNWNGTWPVFVTALGWLMALEGALILVFPGFLRLFQNLSDAFLTLYLRIGGLLLAVLGALLWHFLT